MAAEKMNAATLPGDPARAAAPSPTKAGPGKGSPSDVGAALRNAFRATVDEDIPDEMLDLLRRLD